MGKLFKNNYLDAFAKTVLIYAGIHTVSMVLYTIQTGHYEILNGFSILGFNLFYPSLGKGNEYFFISLFFLIFLYTLVFLALKNRTK